ncbi:MAG: Rid family detoxifying hydrolase [Methanomassiliicoccales archaeon]|nr:Rid family detoxifying hydrolase [Methanomassiliicoccales archaeon]
MKAILTKGAPEPIGPYCQALVHGDLIFCSGQLGLDPASGLLAAGAVEQAQRALDNLEAVLEEAGSSVDRVLKVTLYLTDLSTMADVNIAYGEFFARPYPTRSVIEVSGLPKGAMVMIDLIAAR